MDRPLLAPLLRLGTLSTGAAARLPLRVWDVGELGDLCRMFATRGLAFNRCELVALRGARAAAERIAMNTPIQGSAADLIKLAMIRVSNRLEEDFPDAKVLLQVHDELLLEAPSSEAEAVAELVKVEMERAFPLNVPLLAVAHIGDNWDEAH